MNTFIHVPFTSQLVMVNVKCICADIHFCTLLHLRVEPVWSLRFEPSSAFALSDRKSNLKYLTTKMFICCVPQYWLTGPHPCLHPLYAVAVIKGQSSVHPTLHPGSIKSGIIHISQQNICHCVLLHFLKLLRVLLMIILLGPPSPAIIRSTLSWIFRF